MMITLKLDPASNLNWKKEEILAIDLIQKGQTLLWELDMGLFDRLPTVLSDEAQLLSLHLAIKHFREYLYPKFSAHTEGLVLYRGGSDFGGVSQEEALHYLLELLPEFPEDQTLYLHFERFKALEVFRFLSLDGAEHFSITFSESAPYDLTSPIAVTLPVQEEGWVELARHFHEFPKKYRVISERLLTQSWEGVETLIVFPAGLSSQGRRKLLGFAAAGGQILTMGSQPLNL